MKGQGPEEGVRILVVDDEPPIRAALEITLRDEGFDVKTAGSGAEARSAIQERAPDLILSDIRLPDEDGTQLLSWIREQGMAVPVILITGNPGLDTVERAVEKEASGYLVKPVRRLELLEAIGRALYRRVRLVDDPDLVSSLTRRHARCDGNGATSTLVGALGPEDLERVLDNLIPLCITDESGTVLAVNHPFESLTRHNSGSLLGMNVRQLLERDRDVYDLWTAQSRDTPRRTEMTLRRGGGGTVQVDVLMTPLCMAQRRRRFLFAARDVTEYNRQKEHLEFLAYHDALTGLLNRSGFEQSLERELQRAMEMQSGLAVMYLDIDGFREVTDRYGHGAGDTLLRQAARRMQSSGGDRLILGRLSGDLFMVIARDVPDRAEAEELARELLGVLGQLTKGDFLETRVTASVGITLFPHDGTDIERLLGNADSARARAKFRGKAQICFYESSFTEQVRRSLQMEDRLYRALRDGRFEVHYQPIVEATTGALTAVEALIRKRDPEGAIVSPASFIPVAERSGLIVPIGDWVLERAVADVAEIRARTGRRFRVALNISAVQLEQSGLVERIFQTLAKHNLKPADLEVEITESVMIDLAGRALGNLTALRTGGIAISLDDFGTGYSSLAYLRQYPVNRIKVDRTFVRNIATNAMDAAIARAVTDMARALGIPTVGEGVETEEQAQFLRKLGCDELQGFLYSVPLSRDGLTGYLSGHPRSVWPQHGGSAFPGGGPALALDAAAG